MFQYQHSATLGSRNNWVCLQVDRILSALFRSCQIFFGKLGNMNTKITLNLLVKS